MASFLQKIARMISSTPPSVAAAAMPKSRNVAKERLSLILASQRGSEVLEKVDIEALQRDVMEVIKRHINVSNDRPAHFNVTADQDVSLFEMSVELGDLGTVTSAARPSMSSMKAMTSPMKASMNA
eukprot:scaffold421188_cov47-Attheya_sp.AAC.2